ncbi:hypothetical protein Btru_066689 [Bulinus truncatus]|nr:hypothetical protein Btru_066689 [Bulinus truncatus]
MGCHLVMASHCYNASFMAVTCRLNVQSTAVSIPPQCPVMGCHWLYRPNVQSWAVTSFPRSGHTGCGMPTPVMGYHGYTAPMSSHKPSYKYSVIIIIMYCLIGHILSLIIPPYVYHVVILPQCPVMGTLSWAIIGYTAPLSSHGLSLVIPPLQSLNIIGYTAPMSSHGLSLVIPPQCPVMGYHYYTAQSSHGLSLLVLSQSWAIIGYVAYSHTVIPS